MEGRVRWFFGLARNSGGYSAPMMGTPWEVPEPRNTKYINFFARSYHAGRIWGERNLPMLSTLRIKNLAVVADLTLELQPGLNILTGETGAGKSIVIGALNLVLGQRADRALIRTGAESCTVEAIFEVERLQTRVDRLLQENGLEGCDENQLLVKHTLSAAGQN